jgi:hypothetical protein
LNPFGEDNFHSTGQKFYALWNQNILHHIYKPPTLVPVVSQINTLYTPIQYVIDVHFDITVIFMYKFFCQVSFFRQVCRPNYYIYLLSEACCMSRPFYRLCNTKENAIKGGVYLRVCSDLGTQLTNEPSET